MGPADDERALPTAPGSALGVVLAGGHGSRLGGAKPTADLAGRALISYPLTALRTGGIDAFVIAKPGTELPRPLDGGTSGPDVAVVIEPAEPVHPLAGIVAALRHAAGPLVVLGCDFPFASPALLRALADAPEPLIVPAPGGKPQPLMARWSTEVLPRLDEALEREEPLRQTVAELRPRLLDDTGLARFGDPARTFFNVNTPADLRAAERLV